jgi:flagellar biosynthesis GTPase FlhF
MNVLILTKMDWATFLAIFFTNASGHSAPEVLMATFSTVKMNVLILTKMDWAMFLAIFFSQTHQVTLHRKF